VGPAVVPGERPTGELVDASEDGATHAHSRHALAGRPRRLSTAPRSDERTQNSRHQIDHHGLGRDKVPVEVNSSSRLTGPPARNSRQRNRFGNWRMIPELSRPPSPGCVRGSSRSRRRSPRTALAARGPLR
jgi:hypothetical protein